MIIVMENGYARRPAQPDSSPRPVGVGKGGAQDFSRMVEELEDVYINDLIPLIDATYRTIPDRDHRAMAGLSMGGMETFNITLDHLDEFSYIGGFSGAGGGFGGPIDLRTAHHGVMGYANGFNKRVHLLWLGVGTAEPEFMRASVLNYHDALDKAGIKTVLYQSPGTAHEWQTWRRDLREFAPLLFRY